MHLEKYSFITNETDLDFEFDSIGSKGTIRKIVRFTPIDDYLYNLGFGDLDKNTGIISDKIASNNGDTEKVLATIATITDSFFRKRNKAIITIGGVTASRTRLYQINISKYFGEITTKFEVFGLRKGKWEVFAKGINYDAFAVRRRSDKQH